MLYPSGRSRNLPRWRDDRRAEGKDRANAGTEARRLTIGRSRSDEFFAGEIEDENVAQPSWLWGQRASCPLWIVTGKMPVLPRSRRRRSRGPRARFRFLRRRCLGDGLFVLRILLRARPDQPPRLALHRLRQLFDIGAAGFEIGTKITDVVYHAL